MKIALDAMGGDFGPKVTVPAAAAFVKASGATVLLVGDPSQLEPLVEPYDTDRLIVVPARETIEMGEHPVSAVRQKSDSSLVVAARLVRDGEAQAFVSAGNTGAMMAAALLTIGRIPGIERPAIPCPIPVPSGEAILLDVGANVDCKPKHLLHFAVMGRAYLEKVRGVPNPAVGLLNIGSEVSKGNELTIKVYQLLEQSGMNFVGNIEGRELFDGRANVVVCDGFVGNVVLKVAEGLAMRIFDTIKQEVAASKLALLGGMLAKPALQRVKQRLDYTEYGGSPLLGVNGVAIVSHGSSNVTAIQNALKVAEDAVRAGLRDSIASLAAELGGENSD
ncbi:MAG TPA: phosphate acyltransferase PlsX [Firmicutes bacterium]|nr:phosphate acyltransferase PlsX [Bacillota bacterium]